VVMESRTEALAGVEPSSELLGRAFDLSEIAAAYTEFVRRFAPFRDDVETGGLAPAAAFRLRILMSHEFRRVRLRDPGLPAELLPEAWIGGRAWSLMRDLYDGLLEVSDTHLHAVVSTVSGPLPAPRASYYARFGGIGPRGNARASGAE
jgi:phenylacetic acid degradation operon negative regulatory protein